MAVLPQVAHSVFVDFALSLQLLALHELQLPLHMLVGGRGSYCVFLHLMAAEHALPGRTFPAYKQWLHFGLLLATAVASDVATRCCAPCLYHLFLHLSVCNHGNDLLSFATKMLLAQALYGLGARAGTEKWVLDRKRSPTGTRPVEKQAVMLLQ